MPALITHYFVGSHTIEGLPESIKNGLSVPAFDWGALGPDFLFFHRVIPYAPRKSLRKYGSFLHRLDPKELFDLMFDVYKNGDFTGITRSYIFGFICHYSLDRTAHPYVYQLERQILESGKRQYMSIFIHNKIEHNIDVFVLEKERNLPGGRLNTSSLLTKDPEIINEISRFMCEVINTAFSKSCRPEEIAQSFYDTRRVCGALFDRFGIKRKVFRGLEKVLRIGPAVSGIIRPKKPDKDFDYINADKKRWFYLSDKNMKRPFDSSFYDLTDKAVEDSNAMILAFSACLDSGEYIDFTDSLSFGTGIKFAAQ